MKINIGDEIITVPQVFHLGDNIGNRLGVVISTRGHILVNLYGYDSNPVKLHRYEVILVTNETLPDFSDEELEELFNDAFGNPRKRSP